ncbi:MAG: hypothetical protein WDZ80_00795 [Candidatus Paceibacterota bacterium]
MKDQILIFTSDDDKGAHEVISFIESKGSEVLLVDTTLPFNFPEIGIMHSNHESRISYNFSEENKIKYLLKEIKSVWLRSINCNKKTLISEYGLSDNEAMYIIKDYVEFVYGSQNLFSKEIFILNPIDSVVGASRKPWQLSLAKKIGFSIPTTIFTSSFNELMEWARDNEITKIAVKPIMIGGFFQEEKGKDFIYRTFTKSFTLKELEKEQESISLSPATYQEYVEKEVELRVTVVGNNAFCCAIDGQKTSNKLVNDDWRAIKNDDEIICSEFKLPEELKDKCIKLTHSFGLSFGCIDIIKDKKGNFIFLEINSSGDWFWIGRWLPNLKSRISESIADLLINPN